MKVLFHEFKNSELRFLKDSSAQREQQQQQQQLRGESQRSVSLEDLHPSLIRLHARARARARTLLKPLGGRHESRVDSG